MGKDDYEIEKILNSRKKGNKTEYLVQWKPTWELSTNISAVALIKEFNKSNSNNDSNETQQNGMKSENAQGKRKRGRTSGPNVTINKIENGDAEEDEGEEEEKPKSQRASQRNQKKSAKKSPAKKGGRKIPLTRGRLAKK